jgi:hypothetical protein
VLLQNVVAEGKLVQVHWGGSGLWSALAIGRTGNQCTVRYFDDTEEKVSALLCGVHCHLCLASLMSGEFAHTQIPGPEWRGVAAHALAREAEQGATECGVNTGE